jgi:NAD-dependent dihydropyrimidine dehydrogenase PreA subunit
VIAIDLERCDGCGACIEVCPESAIYLVDGKAAVHDTLCRDCEACVAACPTAAIALVSESSVVEAFHEIVPRPEPQVIRLESQPSLVPWRTRVLPVVGAVLVWAGREIVPRLASAFLDSLDLWATNRGASPVAQGTPGSGSIVRPNGGGGGRQHRRRQRRRGG